MNIKIFIKAGALSVALICCLQAPAAAQSGQAGSQKSLSSQSGQTSLQGSLNSQNGQQGLQNIQSGQQGPRDRLLTLKECTDYAIENNISLIQSRLDEEAAEIDLLTAKAWMLPSVSASTNQGVSGNWFNNSAAHKNSYNGSYGVSASWTLLRQ